MLQAATLLQLCCTFSQGEKLHLHLQIVNTNYICTVENIFIFEKVMKNMMAVLGNVSFEINCKFPLI